VHPTTGPAPIGDCSSKGIELLQLDPQTMKSEMSELPSLIQPNEPLLSHRPLLVAAVVDGDNNGEEWD